MAQKKGKPRLANDLGRLAEESPPVVKLTTSFVKVPGHLHRAIAHPISPHWDNAVEAVERGEHRTHYMMHVFKAGDKCRVVFLESDDHAKAKAETEDFLLPGWYYEPLKVLSFHVYLNVLFCRSKRLLPRDGVALVIAQCRSEVITGLVDELRSLGNLAALDSVHLRTLHVWLTEEFLNDLTPDGSKKQYPSCHTPKYRTLLQKAGWFNCDLSDAGEWNWAEWGQLQREDIKFQLALELNQKLPKRGADIDTTGWPEWALAVVEFGHDIDPFDDHEYFPLGAIDNLKTVEKAKKTGSTAKKIKIKAKADDASDDDKGAKQGQWLVRNWSKAAAAGPEKRLSEILGIDDYRATQASSSAESTHAKPSAEETAGSSSSATIGDRLPQGSPSSASKAAAQEPTQPSANPAWSLAAAAMGAEPEHGPRDSVDRIDELLMGVISNDGTNTSTSMDVEIQSTSVASQDVVDNPNPSIDPRRLWLNAPEEKILKEWPPPSLLRKLKQPPSEERSAKKLRTT